MFHHFTQRFSRAKKLQNFNDAKFNDNDGNNISAMEKLLRKVKTPLKKVGGDI